MLTGILRFIIGLALLIAVILATPVLGFVGSLAFGGVLLWLESCWARTIVASNR